MTANARRRALASQLAPIRPYDVPTALAECPRPANARRMRPFIFGQQ